VIFARSYTPKMKNEYHEGPTARKRFDEGMAKLLRIPKSAIAEEKLKPILLVCQVYNYPKLCIPYLAYPATGGKA
jgi:hypothetical protein